jgi:hypothetical protein
VKDDIDESDKFWRDGAVMEDRRNGVYFGQTEGKLKQGLGLRVWLKEAPSRDYSLQAA